MHLFLIVELILLGVTVLVLLVAILVLAVAGDVLVVKPGTLLHTGHRQVLPIAH
jgi:hypothetical protein